MPVPSIITDLSVTEAANSPAGNETVGTGLDNYIRAHASFIRQVYDSIPSKTGFSARRNAGVSSGVNLVFADLLWDVETFDRGSCFNGTTYTSLAAGDSLICLNLKIILPSADPIGSFYTYAISCSDGVVRNYAVNKTVAAGSAETVSKTWSEVITLPANGTVKIITASTDANAFVIAGSASNFSARFLG